MNKKNIEIGRVEEIGTITKKISLLGKTYSFIRITSIDSRSSHIGQGAIIVNMDKGKQKPIIIGMGGYIVP